MAGLLDLPNELLTMVVDHAMSQYVVRSDLVYGATIVKSIHRRFVSIADVYLFTELDVIIRATDFEDGNNGLWKCLSHPSAKRHTEHMTIKLAFTSQSLSAQEKAEERVTFARGGRDVLRRIERILPSWTSAFNTTCLRGTYYSSLQTIWVADIVLGHLVPYIAQLAPNLKNVTLSTERLRFKVGESPSSPFFHPEGSTALKRRPALTLRNLTLVGCDRPWLFSLLGQWNVQSEVLTIYTTLEGWSRGDHFVTITKVGEWSGFRELELYQKEGDADCITRKQARDMMKIIPKSSDLAGDLAQEWSGRNIKIRLHVSRDDWEDTLEESDDEGEDEDDSDDEDRGGLVNGDDKEYDPIDLLDLQEMDT